MKNQFDISFGNDPDSDRHGIVTKSRGLMNPNHYLAVAISHLFTRRSGWPHEAAVGKTLVSSSMIDRVAGDLGRKVVEVPVAQVSLLEPLTRSPVPGRQVVEAGERGR